MISVRTPQQTTDHLARLKNDSLTSSIVDLTETPQYITALASRIRHGWPAARDDKRIVEHNMLECLRERKGEYGPEDKRMIKEAGGSDVYIKLPTSKIRAGIAHIRSIMLPEGDRAHGVEATKDPSLPGWMNEMLMQRILQNPNMVSSDGKPIDPLDQMELLQTMARREMNSVAKQRARNMDRKITDQLQQGSWLDAMSQFIDDFCTYPAAFLKGPFIAQEPMLNYEYTRGGRMEPVASTQPVMKFATINPFDAYPGEGADSVHGTDFYERVRLTRNELFSMRDVKGYNKQAIIETLTDHRAGKLKDWLWTDTVRSDIADHVNHWQRTTTDFDGVRYYGRAIGYELIEDGVDPALIPEPMMEYECTATLIAHRVVHAAINTDPLARRTVHSSCYEKIPGSVFGNTPSMLMRSTTRMTNATARALQNNLAHASGFQVDVDYTRVHSETDVFDIHPFKVWQSRESEFAGDRPAVRFFQPDSNAPELINVIDYFKRMADNDTGIPEFLHGGTGANTGADATAKGRAMLLDQSAKLLLSSIMNIDRDICMPKIKMLYDYNMINDEDEDIKGDAQIVPKGINARLQMDAARSSHMALMEVTGRDPEDRALIGLEGRAKLLKKLIGTFDDIDKDDIIPADEELDRRIDEMRNAPPPPDPAMLKVEANREIELAKLELQREKLEVERQIAELKQRNERQIAAMTNRAKENVANAQTEKRLQDETVKLRATRMSERERLQIDLLKERMKAEHEVKTKLMEIRAKRQASESDRSHNAQHRQSPEITIQDIRSVVESVVTPMISVFQKDTMRVVDEITAQFDTIRQPATTADAHTINVHVDAKGPTRAATITTTRDSDGNLQAQVVPIGEVD